MTAEAPRRVGIRLSVPMLPEFVAPMLAKLEREPFDSDEHVFEVKWDGIRALAFCEDGDYRLLSRNRFDLKARYPELAGLAGVAPGAVLDGELVVLRDGRPDFHAVLQREQARNPLRIDALTRSHPATYVVFDLLYAGGASLCREPPAVRQAALDELVAALAHPRLVRSEGLVGAGRALFEEARRRSLEGIVAKRLDGAYLPGRRSELWTKIKTFQETLCVILGYLCDGEDDLRSLVVGAEEGGRLVCVGRVGSGLSRAACAELLPLLRARERPTPAVDCGTEGVWVEPELFCRVSFLERTENGLRAPVFQGLVRPPSD